MTSSKLSSAGIFPLDTFALSSWTVVSTSDMVLATRCPNWQKEREDGSSGSSKNSEDKKSYGDILCDAPPV
jgi:hypothetical protein